MIKVNVVKSICTGASTLSIYPIHIVKREEIKLNMPSIEKSWKLVGKHLNQAITTHKRD